MATYKPTMLYSGEFDASTHIDTKEPVAYVEHEGASPNTQTHIPEVYLLPTYLSLSLPLYIYTGI